MRWNVAVEEGGLMVVGFDGVTAAIVECVFRVVVYVFFYVVNIRWW